MHEEYYTLLEYLDPFLDKLYNFAERSLEDFPWGTAAVIRIGVELMIKSLYLDLLYPKRSLRSKIELLERKKLAFKYVVRKLGEKLGNRSLRDKAYSLWLDSTRYSHFTEYVAKDILEGDFRKSSNIAKNLLERFRELREEVKAIERRMLGASSSSRV